MLADCHGGAAIDRGGRDPRQIMPTHLGDHGNQRISRARRPVAKRVALRHRQPVGVGDRGRAVRVNEVTADRIADEVSDVGAIDREVGEAGTPSEQVAVAEVGFEGIEPRRDDVTQPGVDRAVEHAELGAVGPHRGDDVGPHQPTRELNDRREFLGDLPTGGFGVALVVPAAADCRSVEPLVAEVVEQVGEEPHCRIVGQYAAVGVGAEVEVLDDRG